MLSTFEYEDELCIAPYEGEGGHFYLLEDFTLLLYVDDYREFLPSGQLRITVKKGFVTDLASVPRPLQSIIRRDGPHIKEAVIHDWLYVEQKVEGQWIDQKFADDLLYALLRANPKISNLRAWYMHKYTWIGGRFLFNPRAINKGNPFYEN